MLKLYRKLFGTLAARLLLWLSREKALSMFTTKVCSLNHFESTNQSVLVQLKPVGKKLTSFPPCNSLDEVDQIEVLYQRSSTLSNLVSVFFTVKLRGPILLYHCVQTIQYVDRGMKVTSSRLSPGTTSPTAQSTVSLCWPSRVRQNRSSIKIIQLLRFTLSLAKHFLL